MATPQPVKTQKEPNEALVTIPLSALRCILRYPSEGKVVCEINIQGLKKLNQAHTLDEIINEGRLDYAMGNYTTHTSAKSLISELHA